MPFARLPRLEQQQPDYFDILAQRAESDEPTDYAEFIRQREAEMAAADAFNAATLGQGGLGDEQLSAWTRFRMGQGGSIGEKTTILQKHFPDAQLVLGVDDGLLFRTDPARPWSRVDPNMMERFEPLKDIAEFAGSDLGTLVGESIAAIRSRGINLIPMLGRLAAGAAAGKAAQEALQTAMGEQQETFGRVGIDVAKTAGLTAVGAAVASPIVGLVNVTRGAGLLRTSGIGQRALRAEAELGLESTLPLGAISDNPIVQKMQGQSAALIPAFNRRYEALREETVRLVSTAVDKRELMRFTGEVNAAVGRMQNDLIRSARRSPTTATDAGVQVQEGIESFLRESQLHVSAAYRAAREIEAPVFDLGIARAPLKDVIDGLYGTPTDVVRSLYRRFQEIEASPGDLGRVSYTQRLRNLRSDAYEASVPEPGYPHRQEHKQAREFFSAIDSVLKDPANTTPEFRNAWRAANNAAKKRFDTVDKLALIRASAAETNENLARRIIRPGEAERMAFARSVIGPERFAAVQEAFKNDLLNSGQDILTTMGRYDEASLAMLMTRGERNAFTELGQKLQRLDDLGVQNAMRKQTKVKGFIRSILDRSDTAAIDTLTRLIRANGGKRGALGKTTRAAVMDLFADTAISRTRGRRSIDPTTVSNLIKEWSDNGLFRFLDPADMRFIRNIDAIAPILKEAADSGTSLQAGEAVAGLRGFSASAGRTLLEAFGAGRLFLNPQGRRVLLGIGTKDRIDDRGIRVVIAAATQAMVLDDYRDFDDVEE